MNYIKLINAFWQKRRELSEFDPYVIALYFALVDIANRRDWKTFTAYREDIITLSGMSAKPYYKARAILKEAGLIDFKEGSSKTTMCSFTILVLPVVTEATTVGQQYGNTSDYGRATEATTILNKPINSETTKPLNNNNASLSSASENENLNGSEIPDSSPLETEKPKEKSSAKKEKVTARPWADQISFEGQDSPELRAKWQEWIDYKFNTPKKKPYTTLRGEQAELNKLKKYTTLFALYCIDLAIDKEWLGVVNGGTDEAYQEYGKNPNAFWASKGRATLTVFKNEPEIDSPEHYARLKEQYTFSKIA